MCAVVADGYIRGDEGEKLADGKRNKSVKGDECRRTLLVNTCTFFFNYIHPCEFSFRFLSLT